MTKGFKDKNGKFRPTEKKNGITINQLGKLDREATQEELKNLVVEMTPEQMENLKLLKKENVKAKASSDNRMPWERHQEQVNYNEKTGELWDKLDDKTKTKMLLLHGDSDMVVSPNYLLEAQDFLLRNKVEIKINMIKNCQHHIPVEASSIALNYIKKNFNI